MTKKVTKEEIKNAKNTKANKEKAGIIMNEIAMVLNGYSYACKDEKKLQEVNGYCFPVDKKKRSAFMKECGINMGGGIARAIYCNLNTEETKRYIEGQQAVEKVAPLLINAIKTILKEGGKKNFYTYMEGIKFLLSKSEGDITFTKALEKTNAFLEDGEDKKALQACLTVESIAGEPKEMKVEKTKNTKKKADTTTLFTELFGE